MYKLFLKFFLILLLVFIYPSYLFSQVRFQQDISIITYRVNGNSDQSFYPKDQTRYLYEGMVDFEGNLNENTIYGNISYRSTDDSLIDSQGFSIVQMYLGYRSNRNDFVVGDYYAYFSDYSLNNSLKGAKLELNKTGPFMITVLGGVDTSEWDNLWKERPSSSIKQRYVWGMQSKVFLLQKSLSIEFNYGGAKDDRAYFQDTDIYKDIQVGSISLKYNFANFLFFNSEVAKSFRKADSFDVDLDPKWDNAYKVSLEVRKEKYNTRLEYSRIGPHFETTGGLTAQDLESFRVDNTFNLTKRIIFYPYFYWEKDNLKDLKTTTSKRTNPGFRVNFKVNQDLELNFGFDNLKEFATNKSTNTSIQTFSLGISKNFKKITSSLNYSFIKVDDKVDINQKRNTHNIYLNLNGNFNIKNGTCSWNVSEYIKFEKLTTISENNVTFTHSAGLNLCLSDRLSLGFQASIADNNYYVNDNDSNIFHYSFFLSYKIKDNLNFSVDYQHNDNYYANEDNDYFEKKITVKLSWRF